MASRSNRAIGSRSFATCNGSTDSRADNHANARLARQEVCGRQRCVWRRNRDARGGFRAGERASCRGVFPCRRRVRHWAAIRNNTRLCAAGRVRSIRDELLGDVRRRRLPKRIGHRHADAKQHLLAAGAHPGRHAPSSATRRRSPIHLAPSGPVIWSPISMPRSNPRAPAAPTWWSHRSLMRSAATP